MFPIMGPIRAVRPLQEQHGQCQEQLWQRCWGKELKSCLVAKAECVTRNHSHCRTGKNNSILFKITTFNMLFPWKRPSAALSYLLLIGCVPARLRSEIWGSSELSSCIKFGERQL